MSEKHIHEFFPTGRIYDNPFRVIEEHGKQWAADGMTEEEMLFAATSLGGEPIGGPGPKNLAGFVIEIITHQSQASEQGES